MSKVMCWLSKLERQMSKAGYLTGEFLLYREGLFYLIN